MKARPQPARRGGRFAKKEDTSAVLARAVDELERLRAVVEALAEQLRTFKGVLVLSGPLRPSTSKCPHPPSYIDREGPGVPWCRLCGEVQS